MPGTAAGRRQWRAPGAESLQPTACLRGAGGHTETVGVLLVLGGGRPGNLPSLAPSPARGSPSPSAHIAREQDLQCLGERPQ